MKKFLNRKVGVIALLMVVAFAPLVLRKGGSGVSRLSG